MRSATTLAYRGPTVVPRMYSSEAQIGAPTLDGVTMTAVRTAQSPFKGTAKIWPSEKATRADTVIRIANRVVEFRFKSGTGYHRIACKLNIIRIYQPVASRRLGAGRLAPIIKQSCW